MLAGEDFPGLAAWEDIFLAALLADHLDFAAGSALCGLGCQLSGMPRDQVARRSCLRGVRHPHLDPAGAYGGARQPREPVQATERR